MAGKLKLRDETFRRQENRRVCSGRREELFQRLGAQEGQEIFLPAGVKLGCGEKEKGSLQMERGGLREESAGRGLFQQLGPQEGQELFLPTGDLDLGHGEEGSGLCLSEVFEVAEGQELPVLFVQPL